MIGHLRPSSVISQQVQPSSHRRQACVPSHLQPSSVISQQVLPSSHRQLSCVLSHLRPSSIIFSQPLLDITVLSAARGSCPEVVAMASKASLRFSSATFQGCQFICNF